MTTLLHVEASPRGEASHSATVARAFVDAYRSLHPERATETVDLWDPAAPLPPFEGITTAAKAAVMAGKPLALELAATWAACQAVARRFNAADRYVFSVPMWNFSVPYPLKHYIDVVTLPGENWVWSRETGYRGLLTGKRAVIVYASAGGYPSGPSYHPDDFQKPFLRRWLQSVGVTDVAEINVAPTGGGSDRIAAIRQHAVEEARKLAASF